MQKTVNTNIGRVFVNLVSKHFQSNNIFYRIFNKRTLKLNYPCCKNFASLISQHNTKMISDQDSATSNLRDRKSCNCKDVICPLNGKCVKKDIVYRARLQMDGSQEFKMYIGATENSLKTHLYSPRNSFRYPGNRRATSLAKHVWELKKNKMRPFNISCNIIEKTSAYRHGVYKIPAKYFLYLSEKFSIFLLKARRD